ncbi:MAG: FAD-dependent oxidoreductase, partial [Oscillospiraceae bacterium]|nr:FAD-dependent oxidoreductase [Oscillospiraceae bacterium]
EINHCGATQGNVAGTKAGETGFAPSAVITDAERVRAALAKREPIPTREMSKQKIEDTIQKYANAALRCKKAGMKTVMFHGAHMNLLPQFLSPYFNRRTDEYGGSVKNRSRFAVEMLDAVRAAVGEDVVIEYRISAEEYEEGHTHFPETLEFIGYIKDKVDILHVSGGLHDTQGRPEVMRPMIPPYTYPDRYNVHWARDIKNAYPDLRLNVVGAVKSVAQAEEIIASGTSDFVAFMRGLIADPEMPRKYATGREWEHMPCLRCQCIKIDKRGRFSGPCSVNPMASHTKEYPELRVDPAPVQKRVAVIGGGPAGIQALKTLVERGHDVTLYEKNSEIGGQTIRASEPEFKTDMRQYLAYLQGFTAHSGATVKTGVAATPELIAKEGYDALVVAIGAKHFTPRVPGIDSACVYWAPDAVGAKTRDGASVVVVGAGAIGIEAAIELGRAGKKVTIIELAATHGLGGDVSPLGGGDDLLKWLDELGIPIIYNARLVEVRGGEILYEKDGETKTLPADAVALAAGMVPLTDEARFFRSAAPNTEVYLVGDCKEVGDIRDATRGAFDVCRWV